MSRSSERFSKLGACIPESGHQNWVWDAPDLYRENEIPATVSTRLGAETMYSHDIFGVMEIPEAGRYRG